MPEYGSHRLILFTRRDALKRNDCTKPGGLGIGNAQTSYSCRKRKHQPFQKLTRLLQDSRHRIAGIEERNARYAGCF